VLLHNTTILYNFPLQINMMFNNNCTCFQEGFYKDTASWYICWECWAVMIKICQFRSQVCLAQRQLSDIVDGRADVSSIEYLIHSLLLQFHINNQLTNFILNLIISSKTMSHGRPTVGQSGTFAIPSQSGNFLI
jgi:hypothetical protein